MNNDFWKIAFEKAAKIDTLIELLLQDLPDFVLLGFAKPNPNLFKKISPFVFSGKLKNRSAAIRFIFDEARSNQDLRSLIVYSWVQENPKTMEFPTLPFDENSLDRLLGLEFGNEKKIEILAMIDPRETAKEKYLLVFTKFKSDEKSPNHLKLPENHIQKPLESNKKNENSDSLKIEIKKIREDNNALKKELKQIGHERNEQNRQLEVRNFKIKELEKKILELEDKNVHFEKKQKQILSERVFEEKSLETEQRAISREKIENQKYKEEICRLEKKVEEQSEIVNKKNMIIQKKIHESQQNKITQDQYKHEVEKNKRLQERMADFEKNLFESKKLKIGRIFLIAKLKNGKSWQILIKKIEGDYESFTKNLTDFPEKLMESEWVAVYQDQIIPIESKTKVEILGIHRKIGEDHFLESIDSGSFPIMCSIEDKPLENIFSGIFLPKFADREAGIYYLKALESGSKNFFQQNTFSLDALKRRLNLHRLNEEAFRKTLEELAVDYKFVSGKFIFEHPEKVFARIWQHLRVAKVCSRASCADKLNSIPFSRIPGKDEICDFCFDEEERSEIFQEKQVFDFSGKKILIAGGDEVGAKYREIFLKHNLFTEWISGFRSLGGLKNGLGEIELILVILKQISHSLLRELVKLSQKFEVRIEYLNTRGVSGVLGKLIEIYQPQKNDLV
ncbi:MAG: hypothetical protein HQM08_25790 [Candidatus Riflebacteria bacterium]|nr:hypothetical protein [Candidatus Riflebacteria bacterium]